MLSHTLVDQMVRLCKSHVQEVANTNKPVTIATIHSAAYTLSLRYIAKNFPLRFIGSPKNNSYKIAAAGRQASAVTHQELKNGKYPPSANSAMPQSSTTMPMIFFLVNFSFRKM